MHLNQTNDMNYDHSNPNLVIVIDREYLQCDVRNREKGLLDKYGALDDKTFNMLSDELTNHISGVLAGCYLNVLYRKSEEGDRRNKRRLKTMRSKR